VAITAQRLIVLLPENRHSMVPVADKLVLLEAMTLGELIAFVAFVMMLYQPLK
jgi:hypothetical protein